MPGEQEIKFISAAAGKQLEEKKKKRLERRKSQKEKHQEGGQDSQRKRKNKSAQDESPATEKKRKALLNEDKGIHAVESVAKNVKDAEEKALETLLFGKDRDMDVQEEEQMGAEESLWAKFASKGQEQQQAKEELKEEAEEDSFLQFTIDTVGDQSEEQETVEPIQVEESGPVIQSEKAAWVDEETEKIMVDITSQNRLRKLRLNEAEKMITGSEYEKRLRQQFEKIHPRPSWADAHLEETQVRVEDFDLSLFKKSYGIIDTVGSKTVISDDALDIVRLKDANQMAYNQSAVSSLHFHPTAPVLLTTGLDKTLRLFSIDGKINPKISSVYFADLPLTKALFTRDGTEVVCVGKRKYFYSYDLEKGVVNKINHIRGREENSVHDHYMSPCGKFIVFVGDNGYIIIVCRKTKQWIANLKMNGTVKTLDFSADGKYLMSLGSQGEVYQWDMDSRTCVHRFYDQGAVGSTVLKCSQDNKYVATGSSAGVVNIYSSSSCFGATATSTTPSPLKSILNLTTSISDIQFHPSSQFLSVASSLKKNQLKCIHLPTMRVFSNWPTLNTPLSYVQCIDFSAGVYNSGEWMGGGQLMAMGNDKGKVLLYRLNSF